MKIKTIVAFLITIIFLDTNASENTTPTNLLQELSKESWMISVCVSPFKKNTLKVTDTTNTSEQNFPLCSPEDAANIESSLASSFRGLPSGFQNCLREILIGNDKEERLVFTPEHVTIQDIKQKNLRHSNPRRSITLNNHNQ